MKRKIVWVILSCLMVAALVLASCGPAAVEEEGKTITGKVVEKEVPKEKEEEVVVAPKKEGPIYGGTITCALAQDIQGFDEAYTTPWSVYTMHLTNEELLTGDWTKGPAGTDEVDWVYEGFVLEFETCLLAESWESPEPGKMVFHIRQGVHWHNIPPVNGRELTADDIVYSINRAYTEERSYLKLTTGWREEIEVTAPDKWTVVVTCPPDRQGQTLGDFADKIRIVAKEMVEEWGDLRDPQSACGTGPFTLDDFVPASSYLFKKNTAYWRNDPVYPENRLPYADWVKALVITDASTRLAGLRTGKIDLLGGITWEEKDPVMETNPDLSWKEVLYGYPSIIHPRCDKPELPFYDINVRRAMTMGVDYDAIIEGYYGGNAILGCFPVAPVKGYLGMYTPLEEMPEEIQEMYQYNPEKAKQLLAEAGYPSGFKTSIVCYDGQVDLLSLVKDMWADIGIELELDVKEFGVWYSVLVKRSHEELTFRYCTFTSPYKLLESRPDSQFNASMVDDPTCNDYYDQVQAAFFDPPEFNRIMKEYVQYFQGNAWVVQMPPYYTYTAWWPWLGGFHGEGPVGYSNQMAWAIYIWIDEDLKAEMTK